MLITNFHHAGVYTAHNVESIEFYRDLFGMELLTPIYDTEGTLTKTVFLKKDKFMLELLHAKDFELSSKSARSTRNHLAFRTNNIIGFRELLKSKGYYSFTEPLDINVAFDRALDNKQLFRGSSDSSANMRLFFIRGLGGELIEIVQDCGLDDKEAVPVIEGFHHVGIYVSDMDKSIDFYSKVLGFKLLFRSGVVNADCILKMAWLSNDYIYLELLEPFDKSLVETSILSSRNHLCFKTENMWQAFKFFKNKGVDIEMEPITKHLSDGSKVELMFIRGLDGERYEISC